MGMQRALAILLTVGLAVLPGVRAAPPQESPPEQEASPQASQSEEFRLRVEVEVVSVPLVVRNRHGEFVYDLTRDDITLFDRGVPQQLINFELAYQPLSMVILLDTSRRIEPLLDRVRETGVLFTDYVLGQLGEAAVVTFDDEVRVRQKFTTDDEALIRTIKKIKPGGTETRLADALDRAVNMLTERPEDRRRVIVIVSEPLDNGSQTPVGAPLREAQLADISIYTISLSMLEADLRRRPQDYPQQRSPFPPGVEAGPSIPGSAAPPRAGNPTYATGDLLRAIMLLVRGAGDATGHNPLELYSAGTGGLYYPIMSREAIEHALNHLGQDLHNQYLLTYRPSNLGETGFHSIRVQVRRQGVTVRTRPGYYVGMPPPVEP